MKLIKSSLASDIADWIKHSTTWVENDLPIAKVVLNEKRRWVEWLGLCDYDAITPELANEVARLLKSVKSSFYDDGEVHGTENRKGGENNWRGVPGVHMIWHGEWNDPELEYDGSVANYYDVESTMYEYAEEDGIDTNDDEAFNKYCQEHDYDVYSLFSSRKSITSQKNEIYREAFASLIEDHPAQDFDNGDYGIAHYPGFYRVLVDGNYETEFSAETKEEAIQKFKSYFADKRKKINNSRKPIQSAAFHYYDGFEDDVKYFAEQYADDDDIVESVAGDIEMDHPTESPEEFDSLMRAVQIELKNLGYFKAPWQVNSALDTIKVTFDNGDVITTDYNADVSREEMASYYYGKYFNIGNEDEMHKVVKVEFPGTENINSNKEPADMEMAYQLEGYIETDGDLYRQMIVPVIKNLEKKVQKGIYDYDKSLIAWQHVADEGARRYVKELGGPTYNVATRKEVAKKLSDYYEENYMGDNPISSSKINSSNEDKADENGPHMKFKELDPDYEFELREQIEDELEKLLNKLKVNFTTDVWEETVQYILSFFKEDNFYNPKDAKQAVHEWYLETKEYFPDMFDTKKQKLASARYVKWIISKYCI